LLTPGVAKFDPRKFQWLGSAGTETFIVVITDKARVQTLDQLYSNELIIGASASGSASVDFPVVANAILGTKFKIVSGYPAAGMIVKIAMPAGEVEGCSVYTVSALKSQHERDWKSGKIRILAQWGTKKDPQIADVPIFPLGKTEADHQLFELLYARQNYGRPYMAPPGVPAARVAALRSAYAAVFKDPAFKEDAERLKLDVSLISADEITQFTERVMATPPEVIARIQSLLPGGGR
jgi:tripartite-type tricarboxylate transporter receptor subunit TctC